MKPHEIVDEGIWDTIKYKTQAGVKAIPGAVKQSFAKKGWMGKAAQSAAYLSQAEKEQSAMQQAQDKQRLANWLKLLPQQIIKAAQANSVTIPESYIHDYDNFNQLLENKIQNSQFLAEAESLADFMKKYVERIASQKGVTITPAMENTIMGHVRDFVTNFGTPPANVNPEMYDLPKPAADSATKIWNILSATDYTQQKEPTVGKRYANPRAPIDVEDDKGNIYNWDGTSWKLNGTPITGAADINTLNALAYTKAKSAPVAVPKPDADVPPSGGLWTPDGAKNSYTYDKASDQWTMHKAPPPGAATTTVTAVPVNDARMIEKLNKIWAEQGESLE